MPTTEPTPAPRPTHRRAVVLVNPSAGAVVRADGDDDGPVAAAIEALADAATVSVVQVHDDDDIRGAAADLGGDDVLVVAGGDGTLHRVVNALGLERQRDGAVQLLLIPAGTGNDFAGGVGLPVDLVEAARRGMGGSARPIDGLDLGSVVAVNAAHLGVGVQAAQAASDLKGALGKLAYPAGAVAAAARFEPTVVTVRLDGEILLDAEPIAMLGICNGRTVGGGTALCPPAGVGDGLADVVVLQATTGPALAATAASLLRGTHLERDDVLHRRAERVEVVVHDVPDGAEVTWNVDGELVEQPATVSVQVRPGMWTLLLP